MDTNRIQDKTGEELATNAVRKNVSLHGGGRERIEDDLELQLEYISIHKKYVMSGKTKQEIAKELGMSVGKIAMALEWVRGTWEELGSHDGLADEEHYIAQCIDEVKELLAKAYIGDIALSFGLVVKDPNGNPVMRTSKSYITNLLAIKQRYENMRMDIRGLMKKNSVSVVQGDVKTSSITYNLSNKLAVVQNMSEEDKATYLNLMDKYATSPSRI